MIKAYQEEKIISVSKLFSCDNDINIDTRSVQFEDFIREKFPGLLINDVIGMKLFFLNDDLEQSIKKFILAGYDSIILSSSFKVSFKIINFLRQNYQNNKNFSEIVAKSLLKYYYLRL